MSGELRVSFVGGPGAWGGAIRRGKHVLWTCPHVHPNRDYSTSRGTAARECAARVIEAVSTPQKAADRLASLEAWSPHGCRADVVESTHREISARKWAIEAAGTLREGGLL